MFAEQAGNTLFCSLFTLRLCVPCRRRLFSLFLFLAAYVFDHQHWSINISPVCHPTHISDSSNKKTSARGQALPFRVWKFAQCSAPGASLLSGIVLGK
jgi:hypothetical protein